MKQLIYNINITLSLFAFSACSSSSPIIPLNNDRPTKVSDTNYKSGYMQKALDAFIQKKWNPTMKESSEVQKKYGRKERPFTLQEYVDKSVAYSKRHPSDMNNSLVHKMERMPVIGK